MIAGIPAVPLTDELLAIRTFLFGKSASITLQLLEFDENGILTN